MFFYSFCEGNDVLFLNAVLHICGQVKILNTKFINFNAASPQIHNHFNILIQKHGHLIRMTKKLADAINFILLMQLFISSVYLCIIGECLASFITIIRSILHRKDLYRTCKYYEYFYAR